MSEQFKEIEQEKFDEDEENEGLANDDLFNITSWGADLSFRELISSYKENDIEKPELQRHYVWTKVEASRFIESILMGLPVPSIFLANTTTDNKRLIIDGYQRLMSVYEFVETGVFSGDGSVFALSNSKRINPRWRNKTFKQLSEAEQRKVRNTTIHAIIFEQKEPKIGDTSLFQVFERINTGGRPLNAQEIRNCIYQGSFNRALIEINKLPVWRVMYGSEDSVDNRMVDIEYILRFIAMLDYDFNNTEKTQIGLKLFLNDYMRDAKKSIYEPLIKTFQETITFLEANLGVSAFRNYNFEDKKEINKFHATIYDAIAVATALYKKDDISSEELKARRFRLLENKIFRDAISVRTTNIVNIINRINLAANYLYDKELPLREV